MRCRQVVSQVNFAQGKGFAHTVYNKLHNSFATNKTFLYMCLLNEDGDGPMELFRGDKLNQLLEKFTEFYSPNIKNLVSSLKHCSGAKIIFPTR